MMWATFDNDFNKRKLCVSNKHLDIKVITVPLGNIVSIKFELYVLTRYMIDGSHMITYILIIWGKQYVKSSGLDHKTLL